MSERNRFANGLALSISAVALGLVGCGADAGSGSAPPTNGSFAGATAAGGGAPAAPPTGTGAPAATGAAGSAATPPPAAGSGSGGSAVVVPPATGGGAGGATGVITPGAGGAPAPGAGGAAPAGGAAGAPAGGPSVIGGPGDDWTVASNLDSNGLLIPPPAGTGYQVQTTSFDLEPGQEVFKCFHTAFPNDGEFDVGHWESQMSAGSHHFILYTADTDTTAAGTLAENGCTAGGFGGSTWLYTAGSPHWHLPYPDGVAVALASHQKVQFDMHYINTGTDVIHAHVTLNLEKVKSAEFQKAAPLISFNTKIAIPPNGMQTVGGDCTPPSGAKFFLMGTHTHRRGIDASITRVLAGGQMGEELVHTTNWDAPQAVLWETAPYLTFAAGEKFHYSCSYQNDRASVTTVGSSAANNEMCMAITYFFPASSGAGSCN